MVRRVVSRPRLFLGALITVFGVALLATTGASAGERILFKNGHTMDVVSSRVDGAMVYLKLPDGSEVGVPQALIAEVEGGRNVTRGGSGAPGQNTRGRGPTFNELLGVQKLLKQAEASGEPLVGAVTQDALKRIKVDPNRPMTVGFSYGGSIDVNDLAAAGTAPKVSALDGMPRASRPTSASSSSGAPGVKTTEPDPRNGPP